MEVYVRRSGVRTGPFTEDQAKSMLAAGLVSLDELLRSDALPDDQPASIDSSSAPAPLAPSPAPRRPKSGLSPSFLKFLVGLGVFFGVAIVGALLPGPLPDLSAKAAGIALGGFICAWLCFTTVYTLGIRAGSDQKLALPGGIVLRGNSTLFIAVPATLIGIFLCLALLLATWRDPSLLIGSAIFGLVKWRELSKQQVQPAGAAPAS